MIEQSIVLSEIDFVRLNKLLNENSYTELENLLEEADITNFACIHDELVTMNSKILYKRICDQSINSATIVYPHAADITKNFISVLSPLGKAFIGRCKGEVVNCTLPSNEVIQLEILDILYQPEATGDFHL